MSKKFPKTMNVRVLQEDLDTGIKVDPWDCPVAKAVTRYIKKLGLPAQQGCVTSIVSLCDGIGTLALYRMSEQGRQLVRDVDSGRDVQPQTIRLTLMEVLAGEGA